MINKLFAKIITITLILTLVITVLVSLIMRNNIIENTNEDIINDFNSYIKQCTINQHNQNQKKLETVNNRAIESISNDVDSNIKQLVAEIMITILVIIILAMIFVYCFFRKEIYKPLIQISDMVEANFKISNVKEKKELKYEFLDIQYSMEKLIGEYEKISAAKDIQVSAVTNLSNNIIVRQKILNSIFSAAMKVNDKTNLNDMLQLILKNFIDVIPNVENGNILISEKADMLDDSINEGFNDMKFRATVGYDEILKDSILRASQNRLYNQFDSHKSFIAKGWNCFGSFVVNKGRNVFLQSGLGKIKSSIVSPIVIKGKICGMITLDSIKDVEAFNEDSMQFLDYFTIQLSIVLEHAKL